MTEISPLVKLLVILGMAKVTGEIHKDYTKPTRKPKPINIKIIFGIIIITLTLIGITIFGLTPKHNDTITEPEIQSSDTPILSQDECLALQNKIESQAADFTTSDYTNWKQSNCVKVCENSIQLNKFYQTKGNFIEFLHEDCPSRQIILTDQKCTKDLDDKRICKTIIIGNLD